MQSSNNCVEVVTIACHLKSHCQMLAALFQDLKEICILMVAGCCGLVFFNSRPGHWKDRKGREKPVDVKHIAESEDPRPNQMKPLLSLRVLDSRLLNGRSNRVDEHSYSNVHEALRHLQRTRKPPPLLHGHVWGHNVRSFGRAQENLDIQDQIQAACLRLILRPNRHADIAPPCFTVSPIS